MAGTLLVVPASAAGAASGEAGATAVCDGSKATTRIGTTLAQKTLSGPITTYVKSGTVDGIPLIWGRVAGEVSRINYLIFEVDKTGNGKANCYLRRSTGSEAVNTRGLPAIKGWRFRTCWTMIKDTTSCKGLASTTSWAPKSSAPSAPARTGARP
ncbi:hypothetical protein [Streptomyces durbertensis]|nr:hypothetical protein [Streptomyces durbertensis]